MCGLVGYFDMRANRKAQTEILSKMSDTVAHRGPDSRGYFIEGALGLGFRRLKIIDLETGDQPLYSEDDSLVLMCNGEIFNYLELRESLIKKGHQFRTRSDVEVLVHLYEDYGVDFLNKLNGQFAFVIYDREQRRLFLARDHAGICPLYYTVVSGTFIFASEIKAILEHPLAIREVDLTGLDQVLSLPGVVSPRTMFRGIHSLRAGHYMTVDKRGVQTTEYWDLDYPKMGEGNPDRPEIEYVEELRDVFAESVRYRLQADVPVGFFLSGGLDSTLIAETIKRVSPDVRRHSFSVSFNDREICESRYQRLAASHVDSSHHEIAFDCDSVSSALRHAVYHSECPLKETYNTASLALSECAKASGVTVVLNGEGADELFAGYVGYRFDKFRSGSERKQDLESALEDEMREKLWGNKSLCYEKDQYAFRELKKALYSPGVAELFDSFEFLNFDVIDKTRLKDRHILHQRSYLDFKLRLGSHLIADHGDRMAMANSVEARYPYLDVNLIEFSRRVPPHLMLNGFTEKYLLKRMAENLVLPEIINREKFAFVAPGSTSLLKQQIEWVNDLLSYSYIDKQGYFEPNAVESLKKKYSQDGFKLNIPIEDDLLIVVLTFGIFLEEFNLPCLN